MGWSHQLDDDALTAAAEALRQANGNQAEAACELGIPRTTFQARIARAASRGLLGTQPVLPGYVMSRISTRTDKDGEVTQQTVVQKPEASGVFNLPDGHVIKGVSSLVGGDGNVVQQWIKTKADEPSLESIAESIKAALEGFQGQAKPVKPPSRAVETDLATTYVIADWHVGLLAWGDEVGQSYDLTIANGTIRSAMSRLMDSTPKSKQAVILGLGDLLHNDGYENVTPASKNRLDVDGRYPRVLRAATDLLLFSVDLALKKHESVLVRVLSGNHDEQSAIAVSLALAMYYRNEPRVTVDDSPSRFWWWQWGNVLLGATHGDKAKMADLPLIMASRNAEAWGATKFRHVYTGHVHHQSGIEKSGVTVESFQTPAAPDAWHNEMGYGAGRSITAITHDKTHGEILRNKVHIV